MNIWSKEEDCCWVVPLRSEAVCASLCFGKPNRQRKAKGWHCSPPLGGAVLSVWPGQGGQLARRDREGSSISPSNKLSSLNELTLRWEVLNKPLTITASISPRFQCTSCTQRCCPRYLIFQILSNKQSSTLKIITNKSINVFSFGRTEMNRCFLKV